MVTSLREKKKRRTRADILTAAAEFIDRRGYPNANMRDIAAAADVAYQTLYNYFPSKARIALALLARDAEDDSRLPDDEADVVAALDFVAGVVMRRVSGGDRELWREAIIEAIRTSGTPLIRYVDPGIGERVVELLGAAQQHGHLDAYLDTRTMGSVIESLLSSALLDWVTTGENDVGDVAAAIAREIEVVLKPYLRIDR